ncbi:hypothetical protein L798_08949 [Zootermopsis nevadensis]|uniref:Ionotropic glutamate receptor C-terminal domain-containing protein n=1 Tax=Zootermopsis nevadensis TaxID=136037 RepID=A0A067R4T7_ZOONE|nr:hypothetical protein L798_08949 [Zootermopsis nevadensis]
MKLIIAFTIIKAVFCVTYEILPSESRHVAWCLKNIIYQHFQQKSPILVVVPPSDNNSIPESVQNKNSYLVDSILQYLNSAELRPLHVFRPDLPVDFSNELPNLHHGYIIFIWSSEENDVIQTVENHLEELRYSQSWNPRARFMVVVTAYDSPHSHLVALSVSEALWSLNGILNVIIVIENRDTTVTASRDVDTEETLVVNIYTWFPYRGGRCAEPAEVVLIAQCLSGSSGQLTTNEPLFPNKIPKNLLGCPINVAVIDVSPFVIPTEDYTDTSGNATYKFRGLEIEYLLLVSKALNLTLEFRLITDSVLTFPIGSAVNMVLDGLADISIGRMFHLAQYVGIAEPTIAFMFDTIKWYVPCPKPTLRTEKIMGIFSPSVWFAMTVVIVLTTLVFWRTSNCSISAVTESHTYRTVAYCAYNAWSAFMGVSVPEMPRTPKLRIIFFIFVWYCFAMNVIFQAFFTSFLVAPGYEKAIESIDELSQSNLMYGRDEHYEEALFYISVDDHKKIKLKTLTCSNYSSCLKRLFTKGDISTMSTRYDAEFGYPYRIEAVGGKQSLCTTREVMVTLHSVMFARFGFPLRDRFNAIIRRCIESGLVEKYWSELKFEHQFQGDLKFEENNCEFCSNMYFVFSLSHLKAAFILLGFGYVLSSVVFLVELFLR